MSYSQKVRRKIHKNDISPCKFGTILIHVLFNSKQTKEAGRAFKSKMIIKPNNYDKFYCFLMHYLMQVNGTFQTVPRTIVYHRTPIIFF